MSINLINPYRFAGETEFASMYESFNDLTTVNKQHFVEWFTGNTLRTDTWNKDNSDAGYTIEMDDSVNGGLKLINNAVHTESAVIDFDGIRQYSPTASEVISVYKTVTTSGGTIVGLGKDYRNDNAYDSAAIQWDAGNSGGTVYILSSDGTAQSATTTGISRDANVHVYKLGLTSTAITCSVDGVAGTSKTTNRPADPLMPVVKAYSYSGNTTQLNINYYEVYNT